MKSPFTKMAIGSALYNSIVMATGHATKSSGYVLLVFAVAAAIELIFQEA
jgi:hypothetical protein